MNVLPRKIPKAPKRASRWRSQAHCNHVRGHACCVCGSMAGIEVAHVRIGSQTGTGQKPDDWNTVSLCRTCHSEQHRVGERTFWKDRPLRELLAAFCASSPKRFEIAEIMTERANA